MRQLLFIILFVACVAIRGQSQSQQVMATAGGSGQNGGMSMDWVAGETVVTTGSSASLMLTQGFLQPVLVVTAISEPEGADYINAYPNPTSDVLIIQLDDSDYKDLQYILLDLNGKQLEKNRLVKNHTAISMENYPSGVYLLIIRQTDKELKAFQIVKRQN